MKKSENKKVKLKKLSLLFLMLLYLGVTNFKAQTPNSVGIGTTNPDNSSILHLESSNQGFLMTRLSTPQINSIVTPTVGLIIYNTTDQCYWYKRPTYWARLCNTDSINAQNVITNTFSSDTSFTNVNYFGSGIGDSIWVHYAEIDTAIINNLTVHTINADSIFLGGNSITTVITDSIKSLAWLLKGNTGTNPTVNFLGTIDNQDLVFRTNNTEKLRVTAPGNVGIGTSIPHSSAILELKGTDKGFLTTRLTTTQINAIITPTIGLLTYNTDDNCYWFKHPIGWKRICNTDSLGNVFISTLTTNTINAQTINTNILNTNIYNFGSGIGDSIWVHYAEIDTAYIHQLTVNTINADSIYLGGNSITTVITDSITNLAWLLKGNTGTNPAVNFLGTKDNQPLVIRTNNTEKLRVTSTGSVGIGTNAPTAKVDVIGNTKTTNFQMTSGAANTYILQSNAVGSGSWTPPSAIVSVLTPTVFNTNAWTLLGNTGTNPAINFLGTTDNQRMVFRTNNTEKATILPTGEFGIGVVAPTNKLEVAGNTKTTNFQMTSGAAAGLVMQSISATGTGSWTPLATMVSTLAPSTFSSNAWTLLGNGGTNPAINFLGTTDNQRMVFRTNNTEKATILPTGEVGIGVVAPTNKLEVAGNTKTTNFQMTSGAATGYVMQSTSATGTGSWTPLATIVSTLAPSTFSSNAWTILGNAGTTSTVNFVGTTDAQDLNFRTDNINNLRLTTTGKLRILKTADLYYSPFSAGEMPQYSSLTNAFSGLSIYENNGIALKNKDVHFLFNDSLYNTIIKTQILGASVALNVVNNSKSNYLYNTSTVDNSNENYIINGNILTGSEANVVCNPYRIQPNTLTNAYANHVTGYVNSINNAKWNYIWGTANSVTSSDNNYVLGGNNIIPASIQGANVILGYNNNVNSYGSIYLGSNMTNAVPYAIVGSAPGGIKFTSNFAQTSGVTLATGGGAWASISDRNMKENIKEIKVKTILEKIISVPVTEWTYIAQKADSMNKYAAKGTYYDKAPIHIGPMAQDFSEVFGYGEFKDKITTSDIDGVMFSGIQALAEENKELKVEIEKLKKIALEIEELKKLINEIKNR